jgi:hypothetical protein
MKKTFVLSAITMLLCGAAQAQTQPAIPPGKIAVFKAGTSDGLWNISTSRAQPCFVQVFDPATNNQSSPLVSVAMSTNASVPGSVWINAHAGSEGGGISRTIDRQFLALEGYTGNIISPTNAKPSSDPTVSRGIVTLDAFTNALSIYSDLANWFGLPPGVTQNNPTGIASTDGTNFWGTGNVTGTSVEASGTLFYNANVGPTPYEIQNYIQAAAQARIIGGTLYVVVPGGGVYDFLNASSDAVVPLPYDPNVPAPYQTVALTNLFLSWGSTFKNIANFDMNAAGTIAYGADETYGIVKFTNNAGSWVQAPYYFSATNIGTIKQPVAQQGCFGICVDFSGTNPVIYATTMEYGAGTTGNKQGNPNNNRLIRIVDTGTIPGTNLVAQTLATAATTNEVFRGIDFTPDLRPLITSVPTSVSTTNGGSASFTVAADSVYALSYQWLQNNTNLNNATNATLTLNNLTTNLTGYAYQCVVSNNYGVVTSAPPAGLTVSRVVIAPTITNTVAYVTNYVGNTVTFAAISPNGTQPFTYQWYQGTTALMDDGVKYSGSATSSLSISNLVTGNDGNYYLTAQNPAGTASNLVDVLSVQYQLPVISAGGQPQPVTTFVGLSVSLSVSPTGGSLPQTTQWYHGSTALTDGGEYSGTQDNSLNTLTINPAGLDDAGPYSVVISNGGGSVTSQVAQVTVLVPPALSYVSYSNQIYTQNFDSLPDPGSNSVNSINNPLNPGNIDGVAYSLANPFDFAYPVITSSYVGGLGLSNTMSGWYGAADTIPDVTTPNGITRFGAQAGDQTTGGVIDFGPNDNGSDLGTNRALGLLSTSTTGSTTFALKLVNTSTNTLNYINISFIGELWHQGTGHRTMSFGYTLDSTATNFVLTSESINDATLVGNLAFSFPTAVSVSAVDGTSPAYQTNLAATGLQLDSPWLPNAALWLIWSIDYYGSGSGNGYAIDNLSFSATVSSNSTVITPLNITPGSTHITGSGASASAQFSFTNAPGLSFSILATNNITAPIADWPVIGTAVENPADSGNYQFTDPYPTTNSTRFYILRQP